jgi:hypothetical protein
MPLRQSIKFPLQTARYMIKSSRSPYSDNSNPNKAEKNNTGGP